MGLDFHQTGYGHTFFERQLPQLIKALERLADAAERQAPAAAQPATSAGPVLPPDCMAVISDVYRQRTPRDTDEGRVVAAWKAGVACGVTALYDRLRCPECTTTLGVHEAHCAQGRD